MFEAEQASTERTRITLSSGAFPGMETGDPIFTRHFVEIIHLLRQGGRMGVVLQDQHYRLLFCTFRRQLFESATLMNLQHWLTTVDGCFDVHPQYSINLVSITNITPNDDSVVPIR